MGQPFSEKGTCDFWGKRYAIFIADDRRVDYFMYLRT